VLAWLTLNVSLYLLVVGVGLRLRRKSGVPFFFAAAWLVVALRYSGWMWGMAHEIWSGRCLADCFLSWTVCTVLATVLLALIAPVFIWRDREDLAVIALIACGANWLLWEVFAVGLLSFREFHPVTAAIPTLGLTTTVALGAYGLWKLARERNSGVAERREAADAMARMKARR